MSALVLPPPLSLAMGEPGVFAPTPMVWANLLFQAAIVAGVSYLAWFWLVRGIRPRACPRFSFLDPGDGRARRQADLGEPLTPAVFAALFLVGVGSGWRTGRSVTGCSATPLSCACGLGARGGRGEASPYGDTS